MIVVKIEVHPGGDVSRARVLHTVEIERLESGASDGLSNHVAVWRNELGRDLGGVTLKHREEWGSLRLVKHVLERLDALGVL